MRTMSQKRAEFALERVLIVDEKKDFKSFASGAPSMILQNGFGQSLSFWLAKGTKDGSIKDKDKHIQLFDMVMKWLTLKRKDISNNFTKSSDRRVLIEELSKMDQREYLAAQNETLAFLEWVKRFASAGL